MTRTNKAVSFTALNAFVGSPTWYHRVTVKPRQFSGKPTV